MKPLVILSSILGNRSHGKELADHRVARIKQADPAAVVTPWDIGAKPLRYFDGATAGALFTPADARTREQQRIVECGDALSAELPQAEGTPNDTMTPYLRQRLGLLGMNEVIFIAAEGMAMGEVAALEGVALARQRIDALDLAPSRVASQAAGHEKANPRGSLFHGRLAVNRAGA